MQIGSLIHVPSGSIPQTKPSCRIVVASPRSSALCLRRSATLGSCRTLAIQRGHWRFYRRRHVTQLYRMYQKRKSTMEYPGNLDSASPALPLLYVAASRSQCCDLWPNLRDPPAVHRKRWVVWESRDRIPPPTKTLTALSMPECRPEKAGKT